MLILIYEIANRGHQSDAHCSIQLFDYLLILRSMKC